MSPQTHPSADVAIDRAAVAVTHGIEEPVTVVVVDDHELLREGTRQILEGAGGFRVVGEAANAASALQVVQDRRPDLVLVDIRLPDGNGIDVSRRMLATRPAPIVIVLSAYDDDHYVQAALVGGVSGYLLKMLPADELVRQIRAICQDPTAMRSLPPPRSSPHTGTGDLDPLTPREREVVRLVVRGFANKQIAQELHISPRTVEGHLNHVFDKLGTTSRTELVHYALVHGLLVDPEDDGLASATRETHRA